MRFSIGLSILLALTLLVACADGEPEAPVQSPDNTEPSRVKMSPMPDSPAPCS